MQFVAVDRGRTLSGKWDSEILLHRSVEFSNVIEGFIRIYQFLVNWTKSLMLKRSSCNIVISGWIIFLILLFIYRYVFIIVMCASIRTKEGKVYGGWPSRTNFLKQVVYLYNINYSYIHRTQSHVKSMSCEVKHIILRRSIWKQPDFAHSKIRKKINRA